MTKKSVHCHQYLGRILETCPVSMTVNTPCCHARNIQTANMLTSYELTRITESCVIECDSTPSAPAIAIASDPSCSDSVVSGGDPVVIQQWC